MGLHMETSITEQVKALLYTVNTDGSYWYTQSDIVRGTGRNQAGVSKAIRKLININRNYVSKNINGVKYIGLSVFIDADITPLDTALNNTKGFARLVASINSPTANLEQAKKAEALIKEAYFLLYS